LSATRPRSPTALLRQPAPAANEVQRSPSLTLRVVWEPAPTARPHTQRHRFGSCMCQPAWWTIGAGDGNRYSPQASQGRRRAALSATRPRSPTATRDTRMITAQVRELHVSWAWWTIGAGDGNRYSPQASQGRRRAALSATRPRSPTATRDIQLGKQFRTLSRDRPRTSFPFRFRKVQDFPQASAGKPETAQKSRLRGTRGGPSASRVPLQRGGTHLKALSHAAERHVASRGTAWWAGTRTHSDGSPTAQLPNAPGHWFFRRRIDLTWSGSTPKLKARLTGSTGRKP